MSETALATDGQTNKKMFDRLISLIRKCKLEEEGMRDESEKLLNFMVKKLFTKRQYEDTLGTSEGAEKFAEKYSLPVGQKDILLLMQEQKDIFTPNPYLDNLLTAVFLAQISLIGWVMFSRGVIWYFVIMLVIIDSLIRRVKTLSEDAGKYLSRRLKELKATDSEPLSGRVQMKKWQEQSWQLFIHVAASIAEVTMLMEETWWNDPGSCWVPHPFEQRGKARADLQVLYMAQLAVWMYTCFIHRFVDERRKDYFVMYLHHVVTIALVGLSWGNGYLRVGLLVLYVHDVSDIFVDLLKMANYLKVENARGWFLTEISYVTCVVSWCYYRLYQFPFRAIYASFVEPLRLLTKHPRESVTLLGLEFFPPDLPLYTEMNALLFTLLALHIYWFHLFLMIGYRILTESVREASRQEYEGDSDDSDSAAGEGGGGGKGRLPVEEGSSSSSSSGSGSGSSSGGAAAGQEGKPPTPARGGKPRNRNPSNK